MECGKAYFIKKLKGWTGEARLYKLDPPFKFTNYREEENIAEFVVVSATFVFESWGCETMMFLSDPDGVVKNFQDLAVSRGDMDHISLLEQEGYNVVEPLLT